MSVILGSNEKIKNYLKDRVQKDDILYLCDSFDQIENINIHTYTFSHIFYICTKSSYHEEWINDPSLNIDYDEKEIYIASTFPNYTIVRLPQYLFSIYDSNFDFDLSNQIYCLDDLWKDLTLLKYAKIRACNLYSPVISKKNADTEKQIETQYAWLFPEKFVNNTFKELQNEKFACCCEYITEKIKLYKKIKTFDLSQIVVSDTIWDFQYQNQVLSFLSKIGIKNLEITLNNYFVSWKTYNIHQLLKELQPIQNKMNIFSIANIFKGIDANIFNDVDFVFQNHLMKIIAIANMLKCTRVLYNDKHTQKIQFSDFEKYKKKELALDELYLTFKRIGLYLSRVSCDLKLYINCPSFIEEFDFDLMISKIANKQIVNNNLNDEFITIYKPKNTYFLDLEDTYSCILDSIIKSML